MSEGGSLLKGLGIGALLTVAGLIGTWLFMARLPANFGFLFLLGIGVTQLVWVVPAVMYFQKDGQKETVKGILIVAGLTFLLNATCWGAVAMLGRR